MVLSTGRQTETVALQAALGADELHAAFTYNADGSSDLVPQPLYAIRPYVPLPQAHPQTHADRVTLESLIAEPFVLLISRQVPTTPFCCSPLPD